MNYTTLLQDNKNTGVPEFRSLHGKGVTIYNINYCSENLLNTFRLSALFLQHAKL